MREIVITCIIIMLMVIEKQSLLQDPLFWLWAVFLIAGISSLSLWRNRIFVIGLLVLMTVCAHLFIFSKEMVTPFLIYYLLLLCIRNYNQNKNLLILIILLTYIPYLFFPLEQPIFVHTVLLVLLTYSYWKRDELKQQLESYEEDWKSLLIAYRQLKRQVQEQEHTARTEERTRIARDIHDSVGHQLTALTMQLEMVEMAKEKGEVNEQAFKQAKKLAQESLAQMRQSVQALRHDEIKGFSSVLHLIRKLEAQSHIRVNLLTRSGAISAQLSNEQMIIIYRIVQEGLTNGMRYSDTREMDVVFEVLGQTNFVVTMKNKHHSNQVDYVNGFGLTNLKERVEQHNGRFTVTKTTDTFSIEAVLPLLKQKL